MSLMNSKFENSKNEIRSAGLLLKIFKIFSGKEEKLKRWSFDNTAFREICLAEKMCALVLGNVFDK